MSRPRLLVIFMHGSGRYYLDPLFATNRLPRLAELARSGHSRYFQTELPIAAGAWVTLLTGQSVATHGVIDYVDHDARSYDGLAGRHATSRDYADRTIQTILSNAGRQIASIYLPMTNPPWAVRGVLISGFPLDDERRPPTFPADVRDRLPPFADRRLLSLRYDAPARIEAYLATNLKRIASVTADVCRDAEFDVVMTCLPTPDLAHHYFWRPDDPAALERIYRTYAAIDTTIGRLVDLMDGSRDTVVVASDHGGRAAPRRLFGVNRWLAGAGYLRVKPAALGASLALGLTNRAVAWAKRQRINHAVARHVTGRIRRRVSSMTHNTAFVDWSRSRAYGLDFFCPLAGVELNLAGRQADGIVPRAEYEPLRTEIMGRLSSLHDPASGAAVFARVLRREDLFDGAHLDRFPDVVGVLNDDYDVKGQLDLPALGPNPGQPDYPYMGYHGHDAYFCARGPGIRPGVGGPSATMRDLAPTLLALAGVDVPSFMEGQPFEM
jgi:predicted AlkP superfamily phosphohydrolase/phosphomutase